LTPTVADEKVILLGEQQERYDATIPNSQCFAFGAARTVQSHSSPAVTTLGSAIAVEPWVDTPLITYAMAARLGAQKMVRSSADCSRDNASSPPSPNEEETTPLLSGNLPTANDMDRLSQESSKEPGLAPTKSRRRSSVNTDDDDALRLAELGYVQELSTSVPITVCWRLH
jgi:hypothetical protein